MSADAHPISSLPAREAEPAELLLAGARVLDPRAELDATRDVLVRDGRIAELREPGGEAVGIEVVDADGLIAVPAFFDPHVHLRTPGQEHEEDLETGTRAAAAGGYCGVIAMANTSPPVDTAEALGSLRERAEQDASIGIGFAATVSRGMAGEELTDMVELADAGAAAFSDDGLPITSARVLRRALQYQRIANRVIALHEEDAELSAGGHMHEGEASARLGIGGIPSISESAAIERDAAVAAYEAGAIHVQHLSARESVEAVARAKSRGTRISCEATPHHLTLTDEVIAESLDGRFKMNPPLRAESDRRALIAGLIDGTIDCIATDHAPHAAEEKDVPFEDAAMGVTGLETAFAVLHTDLVLPGVLGLDLLVEKLSAGAGLLGFAVPTLVPGSEANIALVDPAAEWTVGESGYESRSANCCFGGRRLTGRVRMTVAAGRVAWRERTFAIGAL